MSKLIDALKDVEVAIFDLDGVVYRGQNLIPNADKIIQKLKDFSIKVVYNSNNSTITRQMYVERLEKLNIPSEFSDFYTSASITAAEITKIKENANVFIIGEIGIREELKALGHSVIKRPSRYNEIDFVIVGLDLHLNYNKIAIAQRCILEGKAQFYATNDDATLPAEDGLMPGAGVMVNAIKTCTGMAPVKIFGKPLPFGIELILNDFIVPSNKSCIFGDRIATDILAGNRAGIISVAVMTGVTSRKDIEKLNKESTELSSFDKNLLPNLVINSLNEIFI